jgi:hypothetical protein
MRILLKGLLVCIFSLICVNALALPADVDATATISATVDSLMEWSGDFGAINIVDHIATQASVVTGSSMITLYTNGDVTITADNTATAQLTLGSVTLVTEYRLEYSGDGASDTGGDTVDYTEYDQFLAVPSAVTHISGDGAVDVTLRVRASNPAGNVADSGIYSATQTLTASWAS